MQSIAIKILLSCSALLVGLTGCSEGEQSTAQIRQVEQSIYYGTRAPSVVNLSRGEQLAIGFLADSSGSPFCSGTLIDRDVVVTASHCTEGNTAANIRFGVGDPNRPDGLFRLHSIQEHASRDVALLFLSEDAVTAVPTIEPMATLRETLPQSMVGRAVEAAGYGETHDNSTGRYFASVTLMSISTDHYTVDGRGQRGICFGDSGGPLLVEIDGYPVVAGVESFGDPTCVDVDHLTRLDLVDTWIDNANGSFDPNSAPSAGTSGQSGKPPAGGTANQSPSSPGDKPPVTNSQGQSSTSPSGKPPVTAPGSSENTQTSQGPTETPDGSGGERRDDSTPTLGDVLSGCSATGGSGNGNWILALPILGLIGLTRRRKQ